MGSGQPGILLFRQAQIHPASPHVDGMGDRVLALRIDEASASFDKFQDLIRGSEVQRPGQRRFQISLQELAVPAVAAHEAHVDPVPVAQFRHAAIVGECKAKGVHKV
jgi:hypothetical protein